jgi:hypothetical protein
MNPPNVNVLLNGVRFICGLNATERTDFLQSGGAIAEILLRARHVILCPPGGNKNANESAVTIALTTHKKVPFHHPDAAIMTFAEDKKVLPYNRPQCSPSFRVYGF